LPDNFIIIGQHNSDHSSSPSIAGTTRENRCKIGANRRLPDFA
jgi:hypothetical protein